MVKIGIVGIGGYGRHLLELLVSCHGQTEADLAAALVVDPVADREPLDFLHRNFPAAQVYRSWDELVAGGVHLDLLLLPVGIPSHESLCLAALGAGFNVLLEKPLAGAESEALAIVDAAAQSDNFVAIGYQDMYGGAAHDMKKSILEGKIGRIRRIKAFAIWGRSAEYYRRNSWAGRLTVDGAPVFDSPFNNALAHYLNMGLFLAGTDMENPATPVSAEAALFRAHRIESCDTAAVHWQTDAGVAVEIYFSHLTRMSTVPEMRIEGTSGVIDFRGDDFWEIRSQDAPAVRHRLGTTVDNRYTMLRRVIRRAGGGDEAVFSPRQSLAQVRAVVLANAAGAIQSFPEDLCTADSAADGNGRSEHWVEMPTLEPVLRSAYEHSRLPSLDDFQAACATIVERNKFAAAPV